MPVSESLWDILRDMFSLDTLRGIFSLGVADVAKMWRQMRKATKHDLMYNVQYDFDKNFFNVYSPFGYVLSMDVYPERLGKKKEEFLSDPVLGYSEKPSYFTGHYNTFPGVASKKDLSCSKCSKALVAAFEYIMAVEGGWRGEAENVASLNYLARFIAANFIELKGKYGESLLHIAAKWGRRDMMDFLLAHKSEKERDEFAARRTIFGKTAHDYLKAYDARLSKERAALQAEASKESAIQAANKKKATELYEYIDSSFEVKQTENGDGSITYTYTKPGITIYKRFKQGVMISRSISTEKDGVTTVIDESYKEGELKESFEKRTDRTGEKVCQDIWHRDGRGRILRHTFQPDLKKKYYERYDADNRYIGYSVIKDDGLYDYDTSHKLERKCVEREDGTKVCFRYGFARGFKARLSGKKWDIKRHESSSRKEARGALAEARREHPKSPVGSPGRRRAVQAVVRKHRSCSSID